MRRTFYYLYNPIKLYLSLKYYGISSKVREWQSKDDLWILFQEFNVLGIIF